MNKLLLFLFFSFSFGQVRGQITPFLSPDTSQSAPDYSWGVIENEFVEVLFPKEWEADAQRAAHLIKRYSEVSGKTYGISKPEKFPLILRPEVALPNGFVTWMPRRSEWFIHQSYTPFIGGLDFFQALAIHEYRHVNQFDYSLKSTNKLAYILFGEFGVAVMNAIGIPNWFFEGDAVWAETKYTNGGRGRSPRFHARLKGLLLSNQIPTYDELVGRSYKTRLPNHYVFGYYLVERAVRLYGEDFWQKVFKDVTSFALNPYRIYSKFEDHSKVEFEVFVQDTFMELKKSWEAKGDRLPKSEKFAEGYQDVRFPLEDRGKAYFLKRGLNEYWGLYERGNDEPLGKINLSPSVSKVDLKNGKLLYNQTLPDYRYSFKSSNDLFIFDLSTKEKVQLTDGLRVYHPQWFPSGKEIGVIEKRRGGSWSLSLFDLKGNRRGSHYFKNVIPLEFSPISESEIYLLFQNEVGEKAIGLYDLKKKTLNRLSLYSRNNIANLKAIKNGVLFEGDYKGRVQAILLSGKDVKSCTQVPIMAYTPNLIGSEVWYASERENGQRLEKVPLKDCLTIKASTFFKGLVGDNDPSVSTGLVSQPIDLKMSSLKKETVTELSEGSRGLSPHSWSFLGGRGFQVEVTGRNYLGTLSYLANAGINATESTPFSTLILGYNKFRVSTSLAVLLEKRKSRVYSGGPEQEWDEQEAGLNFNLPFSWVSGFHSHNLTVGVNAGVIKVGAITGAAVDRPNDETLNYMGGEFSWAFLKQLTFRQIYPEYGLRTRGFYRKVTSDRRSSYDSSLTFLEASLFLPGLMENNGIRMRGTYEGQTKGLNNYRHSAVSKQTNDYAFSRGFTYGYVDAYTKGSIDYVLPLMNHDANLWDFHFLRRTYLTAFYDYTEFEILGFKGDLQSFGGELYLEANFFRRFPLTYGVRYSQKLDSDQVWDFTLASQFNF